MKINIFSDKTFEGWADDSNISGRRVEEDERLSSKYNQGAFTTGRRATKKPETLNQRSQVLLRKSMKLTKTNFFFITGINHSSWEAKHVRLS